jgi:hypothetical protein
MFEVKFIYLKSKRKGSIFKIHAVRKDKEDE